MWQPYKDQGLQVIGIDQGGLMGGDTQAIVEQFIEQTGVTFPVGWDASSSYFSYPQNNALSPFPLDVVVDKEGRIAYFSREYDGEAMRAVVHALMAQ